MRNHSVRARAHSGLAEARREQRLCCARCHRRDAEVMGREARAEEDPIPVGGPIAEGVIVEGESSEPDDDLFGEEPEEGNDDDEDADDDDDDDE